MLAQRPASNRTRGGSVDAQLAPRRAPVQERAQKTVALLLDTAAVLLEEVGVEGFNTNALAARAGVRVRTVYRYFPNKVAVMIALAERLSGQWDGWFDGFRSLADPSADWRALWSQYIDTFVDGIRTIPGGLAIRRAMRAFPELRAVDRFDNERLARQLATALAARGVRVSRRQLTMMARLLVETAVAVLDVALFEPQVPARTQIDELKRMHLAYLESCLDRPRTRRRRIPDETR